MGRMLGDYELSEPVFSDWLGITWAAQPTKGRARTVALTELSADRAALPGIAEALRARVAAGDAVRHPFIARAIEAGLDDGQLFLVREHVDGCTLASLGEAGPVPARVVCEILRKVSRALHAAWDRVPASGDAFGVIHGDLIPNSVLVDAGGQVKVSGFGMVPAESGSEADSALSTFEGPTAFTAPEVMDGTRSHASDVYATGALLYQLLTGTVPPFASSQPDWHSAVAAAAMQKVVDAAQNDELASLLGEMMSFDAASRPPASEVEGRIGRIRDRVDGPDPEEWLADAVPVAMEKAKAGAEEQDASTGRRSSARPRRAARRGPASTSKRADRAVRPSDVCEDDDTQSDDDGEPVTVRLSPDEVAAALPAGLADDEDTRDDNTEDRLRRTRTGFERTEMPEIPERLSAPRSPSAASADTPSTVEMPEEAQSGRAGAPPALPPPVEPEASFFTDDEPEPRRGGSWVIGLVALGAVGLIYLLWPPSVGNAPSVVDSAKIEAAAVEAAPAEAAPADAVAAKAAKAAEAAQAAAVVEASKAEEVKQAEKDEKTAKPEKTADAAKAADAAMAAEVAKAADAAKAAEVAPAASAGGSLEITGDAAEVKLVGSAGTFGAGTLPAGTYKVIVTYASGSAPTHAGSATVTAGQKVTVSCKSSFLRCSVK